MAKRVEKYYGQKGDEKEIQPDWWNCETDDVAFHVQAVATAIEEGQKARKQAWLKFARLYANREFMSFAAGEFQRVAQASGREENRIAWNVCRAVTDTAAARISKNKPRAVFVPNGADQTTQARARNLTKYVEAVFDLAGCYQQSQLQFRDAEVFGTGAKEWSVDPDTGNLRCERVLLDELLVDEDEGRHGCPQQLHKVKWVLASKLAKQFPTHAEAIFAARSQGQKGQGRAEHVKVLTSWHLETRKGAGDSRHLITIPGKVLYDASWKLPVFPVTWYRWAEDLVGFYGTGVVEEIVGVQLEINRLLRSIQKGIALACVPRVFMQAGSQVTREIDNEFGGHYEVEGQLPVIATAGAMPGEVYQHLETLYRKAFELTGVPFMQATGTKPSGLDSAPAQREYNDIASERFILQGQRYEDLHMQDARVVVLLTREYCKEQKVNIQVGKYVKPISWKDCEIDEDKYIMRPAAASFLPSTPAGKVQTAQEFLKGGFATSTARAASLVRDVPDLEDFASLETAPLDIVQLHIENILEHGKKTMPRKNMDLKLAFDLGNRALLRAEASGDDPSRVNMLNEWLDEVERLLAEAQPPATPAAPPGMPGAQPDMAMGMAPAPGPPMAA